MVVPLLMLPPKIVTPTVVMRTTPPSTIPSWASPTGARRPTPPTPSVRPQIRRPVHKKKREEKKTRGGLVREIPKYEDWDPRLKGPRGTLGHGRPVWSISVCVCVCKSKALCTPAMLLLAFFLFFFSPFPSLYKIVYVHVPQSYIYSKRARGFCQHEQGARGLS